MEVDRHNLKKELALVSLGALMHDIGKPIQRADNNPMSKSHSSFGMEFIKKYSLEETNRNWQWVREAIQFHHWKRLKSGDASLPISWFVFEADNLASAHDRKSQPDFYTPDVTDGIEEARCEEDENETVKGKWDKNRRLHSVFYNFQPLVKTDGAYDLWFKTKALENESKQAYEAYPYPDSKKNEDTQNEYTKVVDQLNKLGEYLKDKDPASLKTVNTIYDYFEELFSFIPPDTYKNNTNDVSLFNHLKLSSAIAAGMYDYVAYNHADWLSKTGAKRPWNNGLKNEDVLLLVKTDISGIQDFIYNIASKAALKGLRARSFYLELIQAYLANNILENIGYSKANLIYQGGGGFALIIGNTEYNKKVLQATRDKLNQWLLNNFDGKLFMALEYSEVKLSDLRTKTSDEKATRAPMADAWSDISKKLSTAKNNKFINELETIFKQPKFKEGIRECNVCFKHFDETQDNSSTKCSICNALEEIGGRLPNIETNDECIVISDNKQNSCVELFGLNSDLEVSINYATIANDINSNAISYPLSDKDPYQQPYLYWSLHKGGTDFGEIAKEAIGVERLGVFRADVDNLGKIFSGIQKEFGLPANLRGLSRDSGISKNLSKFFSHYLDDMLRNFDELAKKHDLNDSTILLNNNLIQEGIELLKTKSLTDKITTVYAGGDDLFLVGPWAQIIDFAFCLEKLFTKFTLGKLSISAGISIHKEKHPLYRMAQSAGVAEKIAKNNGKNSLCVAFDDRINIEQPSHCFTWRDWEIVREKVENFYYVNRNCKLPDSFFYYLLQSIRDPNYSYYKLLYQIARYEERYLNGKIQKPYEWVNLKGSIIKTFKTYNSTEKNPFETALNWYLLLKRNEGENHYVDTNNKHTATKTNDIKSSVY